MFPESNILPAGTPAREEDSLHKTAGGMVPLSSYAAGRFIPCKLQGFCTVCHRLKRRDKSEVIFSISDCDPHILSSVMQL